MRVWCRKIIQTLIWWVYKLKKFELLGVEEKHRVVEKKGNGRKEGH